MSRKSIIEAKLRGQNMSGEEVDGENDIEEEARRGVRQGSGATYLSLILLDTCCSEIASN